MKKLFIIIAMLLFVVVSASAQTVNPVKPFKNTGKLLKDTVIKNVKYQLFVGGKGGKFVVRTSAKTGNQYKQYIK